MLGLDFGLIDKAKMYAAGAHAAVGQKRRDTGRAYIVHPADVVARVMRLPYFNSHMVAAAWLHDVVEDTQVTFDDLFVFFPQATVYFVQGLTDDKEGLTKREITHRTANRIANLGRDTQNIKLCDIMSNAEDFLHNSTHGWRFALEKKIILNLMDDADVDLKVACSKMLYQLVERMPYE